MHTHGFICLIVIAAFIAVAGCTAAPGGPQTSGSPALTTGPTQGLPAEKRVEVQVNEKDPIYMTVPVIFAGGEGQISVSSVEVTFTPEGGIPETRLLRNEKGAELTFQGTRGTDRVEATVSYTDGTRYKIVDKLIPYRTRG